MSYGLFSIQIQITCSTLRGRRRRSRRTGPTAAPPVLRGVEPSRRTRRGRPVADSRDANTLEEADTVLSARLTSPPRVTSERHVERDVGSQRGGIPRTRLRGNPMGGAFAQSIVASRQVVLATGYTRRPAVDVDVAKSCSVARETELPAGTVTAEAQVCDRRRPSGDPERRGPAESRVRLVGRDVGVGNGDERGRGGASGMGRARGGDRREYDKEKTREAHILGSWYHRAAGPTTVVLRSPLRKCPNARACDRCHVVGMSGRLAAAGAVLGVLLAVVGPNTARGALRPIRHGSTIRCRSPRSTSRPRPTR